MAKPDTPPFDPEALFHGRRATRCYADLMFAFGFARLGDADTAERLRTDAVHELESISTHREFHRLARLAFECRVDEALRGEPRTGTLDDRCPEVIAALLPDDFTISLNSPPGLLAYNLGRVVECSTILEPLRRFEPYRRAIRMTGGDLVPAWRSRETSSNEWNRLIETVQSPQAICEALQTAPGVNAQRKPGFQSTQVRYDYYLWLSRLLTSALSLPLNVVRRFLLVVLNDLPPVANSFSTAPCFSRIHFAVADPLVLAVVGTGPLPPDAERPERLELLRSVRPPVLKWIEAMG